MRRAFQTGASGDGGFDPKGSSLKEVLSDLIDAVAKSPGPEPLVCPCGGTVVLDGLPAPTYTCVACGVVRHSLADLIVRRPA